MTSLLSFLNLNQDVIERQLRHDLRDDWFPDALRFDDMFRSNHIRGDLDRNFASNKDKFFPRERTLINVPKRDFTLRYGLEVSLSERAVYHAIVMKLITYFDPLLAPIVFNHRKSVDSRKRYLFHRGVSAWKDFNGVVRATMRDADADTLLSTDVANYFENIRLDTLRQTMLDELPRISASAEEKSEIQLLVDDLFEYLEKWCFSESSGLPQNRDASSFLASVYMIPVDRAMLGVGLKYFRYMDDIKIVCEDEHGARKALKKLCLELRERGLSVNSRKTKILSISQQEEIEECLEVGDPHLQRIDSIWQTRALEPIRRSFRPLRELSERLLADGRAESRMFRFCIGRLEALASCPEFEVPEEYFQYITKMVVQALPNQPSCTDQLCKYLSVAPTTSEDLAGVATLLQDNSKNYYGWQNYLLWLLLVQKKYQDSDLLAYAMRIVQEQGDSATRCGATLYAGAIGGKNERIEIAKRFRTLTSFLGQRSAIIAVHELHFRPHIKKYVAPYVRDDLLGVYRELKRCGEYTAPPVQRSITEVLDSERDYA